MNQPLPNNSHFKKELEQKLRKSYQKEFGTSAFKWFSYQFFLIASPLIVLTLIIVFHNGYNGHNSKTVSMVNTNNNINQIEETALNDLENSFDFTDLDKADKDLSQIINDV